MTMTTAFPVAPAGEGRPETRSVSPLTATAIAIADMVGIGVFTSLGFQVTSIPSPFSILMLWIAGGIAALCGALAYAELATTFPRSGGEYNFLTRIYHPAIGFLAGWVSATVGFAAPVALAAMAFGEYFKAVVPGSSPLLLGLGIVWLVSLVHLSGIRYGSTLQNVSTIIKVLLILGFIGAGLSVADPQPISFMPAASDLGHMTAAPFAVSLVFVMYSYSGWNAATYIAGEVRDPHKTLPRAMVIATSVVVLLYVALNAVFLYTTPIADLAGHVDVARIAGQHIFGEAGGRIVSALICFGLISSISAMVWIGPRVTMVMGEDIPMLGLFARRTANGVPWAAILLQLAIVNVLLFTQSFEAVLDYIQFSLTCCSFLAVLGVIVLRITQPGLPRPYRMWGYPLTPAIFLAVTSFMMFYLLKERPLQSLAGLATILAGLVIYWAAHRPSAQRPPVRGSQIKESSHA